MRLYAYSERFRGLVPEKDIQSNDTDLPRYMFILDDDIRARANYMASVVLIEVSDLEQAQRIARQLENVNVNQKSGTEPIN